MVNLILGDMAVDNASEISKLILSSGRDPSTYLDFVRVKRNEVSSFRRVGQIGFYIVTTGHHAIEVVAENHNSAVRICGPGDVVGFGNWFSDFSGERIRLRSLEEGQLHFMPRKKFDELSLELPELNAMIIKSLCKIISLKHERIAALENLTVKARVSALLLSLNKKFGVETPQGRLIDVRIDRATLANLAGTTIESFARSLTELEEANLVARRRRKILIKGEKRLAKLLD